MCDYKNKEEDQSSGSASGPVPRGLRRPPTPAITHPLELKPVGEANPDTAPPVAPEVVPAPVPAPTPIEAPAPAMPTIEVIPPSLEPAIAPEIATVAPTPEKPYVNPEFILDQEMGGRSYYNKRLQTPTWPQAHSGVTIGAGYDLGYNTPDQIKEDWKDYLSQDQINRLAKYSGLKGDQAKSALKDISDIKVDYDTAVKQFNDKTLPKFIDQTKSAFGSLDDLTPDQRTALVSLVFNRGPALSGKNREEMAGIQQALSKNDQKAVPDLFRKMKRLWPELPGLLKRRDAEADLFATGFQPTDTSQPSS